MKRILSLSFGISVSLLTPLLVFAAAVTVDQDFTIILPADGSSLTVGSGGTFSKLDVAGGAFTVTLDSGNSVTFHDPSKRNLANTRNIDTICDSTESRVTHSLSISAGLSMNIQTTPSGTCASSTAVASGGGGGGGSGGGSSSSSPSPSSTPAPSPSSTVSISPSPSAVPTVVALSPTSAVPIFSVSTVAITRVLVIGSTGEDVKALQMFLAADTNVYPEAITSGYFGPKTLAAVKRFQEKYKIAKKGDPGYGLLGPKTRAKIKELSMSITAVTSTMAPTPSLAPSPLMPSIVISRVLVLGSQGADVTSLQEFLASDPMIYPEGIISGYFGPKTQAAVQRFQIKYGIAKKGDLGYGVLGPKTRAKLQELSGNQRVPTQIETPSPSTKTSIDDLQSQLKTLEDMLQELQKK